MAEGGNWSLKGSVSKSSGNADESFCDPCITMGKCKAAEGFCTICKEYLCGTCLEVHRRLKITRAHVILDKEQMPSGQTSVSNQDICVEVCKTHHPEIIRFFCKAHNEPGCGDCMTLKHTTCQKDRVQDISSGFKKTKEFQDIDLQLQQLQHELQEMYDKLDNNLKNLDITYNTVLQKIVSVRNQVNAYLDQTEKKVRDEAAKMKKEDQAQLKTLQAENLAMKDEIELMLETLHDSKVNDNSIFVLAKQAQHRLVTMEKEMNNIKQSQQHQQYSYEFYILNEIENVVSSKTPLGKLSRRYPQKSQDMTKESNPAPPKTPTIGTTVIYNKFINVKGETDVLEYCGIADCTLLTPDRMVVIDFNNNKVKLIDLNNDTLISRYSTLDKPCGVTALNTNTIAVTVRNEGKIQVLNVTTNFVLYLEIQSSKKCRGIAFRDGKFAVSYIEPGRVEILDTTYNTTKTW